MLIFAFFPKLRLIQLHDHDVYKNSPANAQGQYYIRNPHFLGAVLMHLEEVVAQAEKPDTVTF